MHFQYLVIVFLVLAVMISSCSTPVGVSWHSGHWITCESCMPGPNQWVGFSKELSIESKGPVKVAIGADTKYWLWVNDDLVFREGGLKWGPSPQQYYEDEVDITSYLSVGRNVVTIALWHFGKDGFAHKNGGFPSLTISSDNPALQSDTTWMAGELRAFQKDQSKPMPNWRLAESNVLFDARNLPDASTATTRLFGHDLPRMAAKVIDTLMNEFTSIPREIPQWKDYGLTNFINGISFPFISDGQNLILDLPYNAQITPYLKVNGGSGDTIKIYTDNYKGGSEYNIRTTYVCREGINDFESPAWFNGHKVIYEIPSGVKVLDLKYRESGYDLKFAGGFQSNDSLLNLLWKKSNRTLYLTMRDNYMDCPDRERAQWWGDAVLQIGQTFYAYDRSTDLLSRKAIKELMNWQREDSTIYSPVPAGNWDKELPTQMLASVGYYGIWNYYMHTGDIETIREVYPKVKKYLAVWKTDSDGLVIRRKGGWTWGDWGDNKDMALIFNGWYYLALKGAKLMADELGENADAIDYSDKMNSLKIAFNQDFWNGKEYQSPTFRSDKPDERGHALAILAGIAEEDKWEAISEVLLNGTECSPYFEKYVLEALLKMGHIEKVQERMKSRYATMLASPITTLWEGWQVGSATWGGGTYNHSWSGGPLTLMSQYMAGIEPISPGYDTISIKPQMGNLNELSATVMSIKGPINVSVKRAKDGSIDLKYKAPDSVVVLTK